MGFLDFLDGVAELADYMGTALKYEKMYGEYDEEELFYEYVRLSKKIRFYYDYEDDDKIRLEAVKTIMKQNEWY